jgi:hypothetical protein
VFILNLVKYGLKIYTFLVIYKYNCNKDIFNSFNKSFFLININTTCNCRILQHYYHYNIIIIIICYVAGTVKLKYFSRDPNCTELNAKKFGSIEPKTSKKCKNRVRYGRTFSIKVRYATKY